MGGHLSLHIQLEASIDTDVKINTQLLRSLIDYQRFRTPSQCNGVEERVTLTNPMFPRP